MVEPPEVVDSMMTAHDRLFADTSFREDEIAPGGTVSESWKAVIQRHADRILVGSDTYANHQWEDYGELIATNRRWLAQLPEDVALAIAYRNGLRLFGLEEPASTP
jgi:hypothetical protein